MMAIFPTIFFIYEILAIFPTMHFIYRMMVLFPTVPFICLIIFFCRGPNSSATEDYEGDTLTNVPGGPPERSAMEHTEKVDIIVTHADLCDENMRQTML